MSDTFDLEIATGGPFATNTYLVTERGTGVCAVIDPTFGAADHWAEVIEERGLRLESIILTHGHIDHIADTAQLAARFPDAAILIHADDEHLLAGDNAMATRMLGLPPYTPVAPTGHLKEGVPLRVGSVEFQVTHVPGHCPGHVMLLSDRTLISGDVLFNGSIGRTDLPGGDFRVLADSIINKLMTLHDDTVVYSGHGPVTTIGAERLTNPFIPEMRRQLERA